MMQEENYTSAKRALLLSGGRNHNEGERPGYYYYIQSNENCKGFIVVLPVTDVVYDVNGRAFSGSVSRLRRVGCG